VSAPWAVRPLARDDMALAHDLALQAMERRREPRPVEFTLPLSRPIAAVMVPVPDVAAGFAWYERAFPRARRERIEAMHFERLVIDGVGLEIVPADEKLPAQAGGSVVYWSVESFEAALAHLSALGATLRRGPMDIERGMAMAQVADPWGNLIGLRGPRTARKVDAP